MMIIWFYDKQNANIGGDGMFPNLQAEQARFGMTNQQVADYLGVSRITYEKKKRNGKFVVDDCFRLCKLYSCNFEYLFKQIGEKEEKNGRLCS